MWEEEDSLMPPTLPFSMSLSVGGGGQGEGVLLKRMRGGN